MAIPGIWPLAFTKLGYKGQLAWLSDLAVCQGKEAYSSLLSAAKEGELEVPLFTTIKLLDGEVIHLGPDLTTPTAYHLARTPDILITTLEDKLVVSHRDNEREKEDGEEEEGDDEEAVEVEENINEAEGEGEDSDDDEDEEERKEEIKKAKKPWNDEDVIKQKQQEKRKRQQVHVSYSVQNVTSGELRVHFSQFGEVKEVFILPPHRNYAVITFQSDVVSNFLFSASGLPGREEGERTHTLQRPGQFAVGDGQPVRLTLRGGSGRGHRIPPRLQRHATCSLRYCCVMYLMYRLNSFH